LVSIYRATKEESLIILLSHLSTMKKVILLGESTEGKIEELIV